MKVNAILDEEFKDWIKVKDRFETATYPVYVNPSKKEIIEIGNSNEENEARVLIDKNTKDVYVFNPEVLHNKVTRKFGINMRDTLQLIGQVENGKVVLTLSKLEKEFFKDNPELFDKYFKSLFTIDIKK